LAAADRSRRPPRPDGVQEKFWEIIALVEQTRMAPALLADKRSAQNWLLRAAGPVGAIKNGGGDAGGEGHYALALFRLARAEALLRTIGSSRLADRLEGLMGRLRKLRAARWGPA